MRLYLDAVQRALRAKLRLLLTSKAPDTCRDDTSTALARLGLWNLTLPITVGGLDLGLSVGVVAAEELGRALFAASALETMHAADLVVACDREASKGWLEQLGAGRLGAVFVGWRDEALRSVDDRIFGESEPMSGSMRHVDDIIAVAQAREGVTAYRVGARASGVVFQIADARDDVGRYVFNGPDGIVRVPCVHAALVRTVLSRMRIRHAAYLVGTVEHMLEVTLGYVRGREVFGRRLVEFQTVAARLAEVRACLEGVRLLVFHAAWCHDEGEESVRVAAAESLAAAAELALHMSRVMMQLHGASGMLGGAPAEKAYRTVAREAIKFGSPASLWTEAGMTRLGWDTRVGG